MRKKNRYPGIDYTKGYCYFITFCTHNKKAVLSNVDEYGLLNLTNTGRICQSYIEKIAVQYPGVTIDSFVIMPNHVHLILNPSDKHHLSKIISFIKANTTKQSNVKPLWQRSFHEIVLRNQDMKLRAMQYIKDNPFKWHLDKYYVRT
jgi:REP element-mobilizing transposase RayT